MKRDELRLPPDDAVWPLVSYEAEMSALGACLLSNYAAATVCGMLNESDFYRPGHRIIFRALSRLVSKRTPIDFLPVVAEIGSSIGEAGGEDYLLQVADSCPSPTNAEHYAKLVLDTSLRRSMVLMLQDARSQEVTNEELLFRLNQVREHQVRSTPPRTGKIGDFAGKAKRSDGVPTGFALIDKTSISGGLPRKQVSIVMAETGGGKTAWSIQVGQNVAENNQSVCYATFADLGAEDIANRLTKNIAGFVYEPKTGTPEHERWCEAVAQIRRLDMDVFDVTENFLGRDVETFCDWFKAENSKKRQQNGRGYDLLIVDYAQELTSRNPRAKNNLDEANCCAMALGTLAREENIALLLGSQITLQVNGKEITKGSSVWAQRAAIVLKIQTLSDEERKTTKGLEEPYKSIKGLTIAHLKKNRFGKSNIKAWWQFTDSNADFREIA